MKNSKIFTVLLAIVLFSSTFTFAQETEEESTSPFSIGADFYSNYVWRGSKLGTGPAFQPSVKFAFKGLTIGVWGSFDAQGYAEADPYISYSLPFGLSLGITDYYYPGAGGDVFSDSTNAVELNVNYSIKGLSLSANYILNEAPYAANSGEDMYFQAGYSFKNFNISIGAGDGWHTSDTEFNVCHIALGTSKTIEITDKFSIPVNGSIIVNPDKKQMFLVVGFSL